MQERCSDDNFTMPTYSLFKGPNKTGAQAQSASSNDVTIDGTLYAITVNIAPTKLVNKKQWCTYTHDKQRAILGRLESSFRTKNPDIKLHRIEYEACPTVGNIHFHALYEMPEIYLSTLQNYWDKFDSTDKKTRIRWRHLDVKLCHNMKGWIEYITKTINN